MHSAYTILIAEDDESIRQALTDVLTTSGYEVRAVENGLKAIDSVRDGDFDLALLDVAMPGADGFQVLSVLADERPGTPVIMLTARGEEEDRIRGLSGGADDYIVKPFSIRELLARIEAVLRRSPERPRLMREISISGVVLDQEKRELIFDDGSRSSLTAREFELLSYMARHADRVVTRDELIRRVWNMDPRLTDTRSVEMTFMRLRNKLGTKGVVHLETIRGQGYRWNSTVIS